MLRRTTPSSATLTGGTLSVDILHTEDSIRLGDGTDLLSFQDQGGTKTVPVTVLSTTGASDSTLTGGTSKFQIYDPVDTGTVEIDDVGGEKALKVSVIASVGGGGGGTAATDSAAYTPTATQFTPTGGAYDDVSPDALAEGEMGVVRMTSARAMHVAVQNTVPVTGTFYQATQPVSIASMPATPVTDNGGSLTVDGSVSISGTPTVTVGNASLAVTGTFYPATQPVSGTVSVDNFPASQAVTGTFWQATQPVSLASVPTHAVTDGGGSLTVDGTVGISGTVPVSGTFWQTTQPVSGTITASNTTGNIANDAVDSGNPVKIGGRAQSFFANGPVATNDRVDAMFDPVGRFVTCPVGPRGNVTYGAVTLSSTTATTIMSAGGAGVYRDITQLVFSNSSSTAVNVTVASNGGTYLIVHLAADGGGAVIPFPVPLSQITANTTWTVQLSSAVSSVYCFMQVVNTIG